MPKGIPVSIALLCFIAVMMAGCTNSTPAPVPTPTPQIIYVTVTPTTTTPTIQTEPKEMAYLKNVDCEVSSTVETIYRCTGSLLIPPGTGYSDAMVVILYPDSAEYEYDVGAIGGNDATQKPFSLYPDSRYSSQNGRYFVVLDKNQFPVSMTGMDGVAIKYGAVTTPKSESSQSSPTETGSKSFSMKGSGDDVQSFTLFGDGMRIFAMSYSGDSNFAIWLKDSQGNDLDLLANEIGSYSGKKSERLGPGTYYLDVTASGPWTVTLTSM